jgi:ribosomal protein S18 acetylase RimI-like enzyme
MTPLEVRVLGLPDAEAFIALRREALESEPIAFSADPAADRVQDPAFLRARLLDPAENAVLGAFAPGLVGAVGIYRDPGRKAAHKAHVWGMYVRPAWRGRGAGAALLSAAIACARGFAGVRQVQLGVSETAQDALRLYRRHGFTVWGTEPAALQHAGQLVAEHHMVLALEGPWT